jgi:hypothetical protein
MKRFLIVLAFVGVLLIVGGQPAKTVNGARLGRTDRAIVNFEQPTKLMNVVLRGEYVFIHDEEKMEAGEDCTYVYRSQAGAAVKLVLSFHCQPVTRMKVSRFTIRTMRISTEPLLYEIQEYQFAGTKEAHRVPTNHEAINATVDVVGCCD